MTVIEELRIAASPERLWEALVERGGASAALPGLRPSTPGRGTVRASLGGHAVTYRGYGRQHVEEPGRRVTWTLSGREVRGEGRAHVEVRARLKPAPGGGCDLRLTVLLDGRGRLEEAGEVARDRAVSQGIARFRRAVEGMMESDRWSPPAPAPTATTPREPQPQLEIMPPSPIRERARVPGAAGALAAAAVLAAAWATWRYLRRR